MFRGGRGSSGGGHTTRPVGKHMQSFLSSNCANNYFQGVKFFAMNFVVKALSLKIKQIHKNFDQTNFTMSLINQPP